VFRFEEISFLYWLIAIPVLLGLFYLLIQYRNRRVGKIGEANLIQRLMPGSSLKRRWIKNILLLSGLGLLLFSASNPQWGTKKEKTKVESADIFIAFDISQSMMAQDISPSRLERAKRFTEKMLRSFRGDRIGLIYFAGDAYLQMPLTNDYAAAELFIKSANPNLAGTQGTAIDEAIDLALKAYEDDVQHQRALIIISDGEDHEGRAVAKAKEGADGGLVIYTIGVGTENGAFVPYLNRGRAEYKKDDAGSPVTSKLNIESLQEIARNGGGEFYLVNQGEEAIADLKSRMDRLQRREVEQKSFSEYNSYFQWFLGIGLFLLLLDWVLPNGRKNIF